MRSESHVSKSIAEVEKPEGGGSGRAWGTCVHELPCDCSCKQTAVLIIRNTDGYDEPGIQGILPRPRTMYWRRFERSIKISD